MEVLIGIDMLAPCWIQPPWMLPLRPEGSKEFARIKMEVKGSQKTPCRSIRYKTPAFFSFFFSFFIWRRLAFLASLQFLWLRLPSATPP